MIQPTIVIRTAAPGDAALRRLAELDEDRPLEGPALLAEVDGMPHAAVALNGGRLVADPFARTADVAALLRLRAERLRRERGDEPSRFARLAALVRRPSLAGAR